MCLTVKPEKEQSNFRSRGLHFQTDQSDWMFHTFANHPREHWRAVHSPPSLTQRSRTKKALSPWAMPGGRLCGMCVRVGRSSDGPGEPRSPASVLASLLRTRQALEHTHSFLSTTVSISEGLKIWGTGSTGRKEGGRNGHPRFRFSPLHPSKWA